MKKKVLNFTLVFVVMILIISILTGCGRKTEEKIVYANIVIESVDQNEKQTITTAKPNRELLSTYEELINSSAVKTVIEKQYRTIGDVQFEEVENTQIIRVIYVCDNHTDD